MALLLLYLCLALLWLLLSDDPDLMALIIGFVLAHLVIMGERFEHRLGTATYLRKVRAMTSLIRNFAVEMVKSNIEVALSCLGPIRRLRPAVIAVPIEGLPPLAVAALANMISLTPGTASLDISEDGLLLYVHAMHGEDADSVRAGIERNFTEPLRVLCS